MYNVFVAELSVLYFRDNYECILEHLIKLLIEYHK